MRKLKLPYIKMSEVISYKKYIHAYTMEEILALL